MSRNRTAVVLALFAAAATGAACAGSSSETPWPVEPVNLSPGPAGEQAKEGVDIKKLPNRYGEAKDGEAEKSEAKKGDGDASFDEQEAAERAQREQDKLEEERDKARIEKRKREQPGGQGTDPMRASHSPMSPY